MTLFVNKSFGMILSGVIIAKNKISKISINGIIEPIIFKRLSREVSFFGSKRFVKSSYSVCNCPFNSDRDGYCLISSISFPIVFVPSMAMAVAVASIVQIQFMQLFRNSQFLLFLHGRDDKSEGKKLLRVQPEPGSCYSSRAESTVDFEFAISISR